MNANILNDAEFAAQFVAIELKAKIGEKRSGVTGRASFHAHAPAEPDPRGDLKMIDRTPDNDADPRHVAAIRSFIRNKDGATK